MEADTAELHTPPLNEAGLPRGYAEYAARTAIRDLRTIYGRSRAAEIVEWIAEEELERRK